MKKLFSLIAVCCVSVNLFAQGTPVFDLENWLKTIDDLYATYDLVENSITQIENQYRQIQMAIDNAKGIDWDNIRFDGDFDIRNDIRNANRRVDRLLSQTRMIRQSLSTPVMNLGGNSYSIEDLCGINGNNKNVFAAIKDVKGYMTENMQKAIKDMTTKMTEEEKINIWSKYGISPENYLFVQQSVTQVKDAAAKVIGKVQEQAVEMRLDAIKDNSKLLDILEQSRDSDGNITEGASREATIRTLATLIDQLSMMNGDINDIAALTGLKMIEEQNEKEAKAAEEKQLRENKEAYDNSINSFFMNYGAE